MDGTAGRLALVVQALLKPGSEAQPLVSAAAGQLGDQEQGVRRDRVYKRLAASRTARMSGQAAQQDPAGLGTP